MPKKMNDKKPTEVCTASVKDPAYMHHEDCSRHQEKPMGWETKFWKTVNEYGNGAHIDLVYKLKAFIDSATATAFDEGKSYWEPSEHHKDVWRNEGAKKAMKLRDAEVDAAYDKGYETAMQKYAPEQFTIMQQERQARNSINHNETSN